ncbi:hypothetical protein SOPP22_17195 [Shewanella sp. OPT22]|nr:hypothetical protein SOPP22_17195 [Shewanella sp. OPT22]
MKKRIFIALISISFFVVAFSLYRVKKVESNDTAKAVSHELIFKDKPLESSKSLLEPSTVNKISDVHASNEDDNECLDSTKAVCAQSNDISKQNKTTYCLEETDSGQCAIFTLNSNFKKTFYDEKADATLLEPMIALLSAENFHEVMLNMHSLNTNNEIVTLENKLNEALQSIIERGAAVGAQPVRCGDYLCAVDLGNVTTETSELILSLLHSIDSRLGNIFTSGSKIIFSLDNSQVVVASSQN